jgi:HD-GYP domain-containing protein (c-di-GMP phosphodiesterase class II)
MTAEKDEIVRCLYQTIATLASMPGIPNSYIPQHQQSVSQISRTLAQIMQVERDVVDGLRIAATLHDCGLVMVPAEILNKPGPLTDDEFAIVKGHPALGQEILSAIDFPWPVAEIVLQHHEMLDGSGYPRGLKGDDILFEAQIIAVADAMDTMISARPYRPAMTVEAALADLQKYKGIRYDRGIVEACVELYTKQSHRLDPEYYGRG